MLRLLALCFFVLPGIALAENGILIEHVPKGATSDVVANVVKQAFLGRKWIVDSSTDSTVSARIERRGFRTQVTIAFVDRTLTYSGNAQRLQPTGNPANYRGTHWVDSPLPRNWLANLRADVSRMLATIPDR